MKLKAVAVAPRAAAPALASDDQEMDFVAGAD